MNELEKNLLDFICRFAREVTEITYFPFINEPVFYFGKYSVELLNVCDSTEETNPYWLWEDTDITVQERFEDDELAAYLVCEGELYEGLYNFMAMGSRIWGEDTEKIHDLFLGLTREYGLDFYWCNGAVAFYQSKAEKVQYKSNKSESRLSNKDLFKFIYSVTEVFFDADATMLDRMYYRFGHYSCSLKDLIYDYEIARTEISQCGESVQEFLGEKNAVACLECPTEYCDIFYEHYRGTCEADDELKDAYDGLVDLSERTGLYFGFSGNMIIFYDKKRMH